MLTQVGVKQLTDFLRTVTAASDLVDCTLVNCDDDGGPDYDWGQTSMEYPENLGLSLLDNLVFYFL